jgi:hypothetical protein
VIWLVDDGHLGRILRGQPSVSIGSDDTVATTGLWYVRLCQAVSAREHTGTLSSPFAAMSADQRARALAAVMQLPEQIDLPSLRTLGPLIGALRARHALNLLATEALAASVLLDATVLLSAPSPRLRAAVLIEGGDVVLDR